MVLSSLEMWQKQNVHSHIHLSIEDNEKHTQFFSSHIGYSWEFRSSIMTRKQYFIISSKCDKINGSPITATYLPLFFLSALENAHLFGNE